MMPSHRSTSLPLTLALALSLGVFCACDPCSGVASCSSGSYLSATGQIVDQSSGAGIIGVRIDVVRTGGIDVDQDSLSAVTSGGGFWRVQFSPRGTGTLVADVSVSPPNADSYSLHGVLLKTREHGGDANLNERWVPHLYFNYAGEFFLAGTADERVDNATVHFRRTSGVEIYGPGVRNNVYESATDPAGRVALFPTEGNAVFAREDGILVGDITVRLAGAMDSTVLYNVGLAPNHTYASGSEYPPIIREPVGPGRTTYRR